MRYPVPHFLVFVITASLSFLILGIPFKAQASVSAMSVLNGQSVTLWVGPGGGSGISNINISVDHTLSITDGYNQSIPNDGTVQTGKTIRLKWLPNDNDISWVGTGSAADSPYGRWDSSPRSCSTINTCDTVWAGVGNIACGLCAGGLAYFGILYQGDMALEPQVFSVSATGATCTAPQGGGVTIIDNTAYNTWMCSLVPSVCSLLGPNIVTTKNPYYSDCTVTAPVGNPVHIEVTWPPMTARLSASDFMTFNNGVSFSNASSIQTSFTIPSTVANLNFSSIEPNTPPNRPALNYPSQTPVNVSTNFSASATDPDGDDIRYGFDWDYNGTIDEWVPSTGYVHSGTSQTISHQWTSEKMVRFKVSTQDVKGMSSSVTRGDIIVANLLAGDCVDPVFGIIHNSGSVDAYQTATPLAPLTCALAHETRTCTNGVLSGSYTYQNCKDTQCVLPWGGSIDDGESIATYRTATVTYPSSCMKYLATCYAPNLNYSNRYNSCFVDPPNVTLTASPTTIRTGESATLSWVATGINRTGGTCVGTGFTVTPNTSFFPYEIRGAVSTGVLNTPGNYYYQIICHRSANPIADSSPAIASVTVTEPTISISASPQRLKSGQSTVVSWASDVTGCTISGPGLSSTDNSGSSNVTITRQSTFTITCGATTRSTTVNTVPSYRDF